MSDWKIKAVAFVDEELQVTFVSSDGKNKRIGKIGADLLEKLLIYAPGLHDGKKAKS